MSVDFNKQQNGPVVLTPPVFGSLSLREVNARLNAGESPEDVAAAAGMLREQFVRALAAKGLRPVRRWSLEVITPDAAVLEAINAAGRETAPFASV